MPQTNDPIALDQLKNLVEANDKNSINQLIGDLVAYVSSSPDDYDPGKASDILYILRRRRLFEEMRRAGDAFINNDCSSFKVRKYYAQALVDLGYLASAKDVLINLKQDTDIAFNDSSKTLSERNAANQQWAEACGLLGRVYKDRYVNANAPNIKRNQSVLNKAIRHYYLCYVSQPDLSESRHWHGINAVALTRLAELDQVPIHTPLDALELAKTILKEIEDREATSEEEIDIWATAIAMEACISIGDNEAAYKWAVKYVDPTAARAEKIDAFEVASTLRQLEEVWKLNVDREPGHFLIPLLRTRLQSLEGFSFKIADSEPISQAFLHKQANSLEKRFGGDFLSFRTYSNGISRAQAVARIGPSAEEHLGTGFLIDGGDLNEKLRGQRLLVTCDHVLSDRNLRSLRPNRAIVTFRANAIKEFDVAAILWSKPEGDLDISILSLVGDTSDLPVVPFAEIAPGPEEKRVLIFGHAEGGTLSFSFGDNRLIGQNEQFIQYRAPTVSGSSGSPVFNTNWELIAIHHRGGYSLPKLDGKGTHKANQGSSILALRKEIKKDPQRLLEFI